MNRILLLLALPLLCLPARAQNAVDRFYLDMRTSFHQETEPGTYRSQLVGEYLNLQLLGHVSENVTYRIRQRLNKKVYDERNMFNATDFMCVTWQASPRWSLTAGKQAVLIGGYEYDAPPIDVYFYSQFCNNLYQAYSFGVSGAYEFSPSQRIVAQVCNSPLSLGYMNIYAWNLAWDGQFAPWWKTLWSMNMVEDAESHYIHYTALGNHFIFRDAIFDVDLMNRTGLTQKHFFLGDFSVITKLIWSVGDWNLCAKAGYERNLAGNVDADGRPFDAVIAPGTKYLYAGGGLEWFPLGRDHLRLHAVFYRDNAVRRNNIDIGVTWRADIITKPLPRRTSSGL
jgi:hypothetical protein